mmetsp:Transcript_15133/g.45846  ORF Transcript_15133/g.45846 Transcript_15133/m.45846 type:complete len:682 (-) Transcript_15133:108-2153(-)
MATLSVGQDLRADEETPPFALSIPLHEALHCLRATHGLTPRQEAGVPLEKAYRHYRKALSRQIARLRFRLKLTMRTKRNKQLVLAKLDRCESDERVLLEALLAERAWVVAMEAKQQFARHDAEDDKDSDANGGDVKEYQPPRRCRMRLRRATKVAAALEFTASTKENATDKLKQELRAFAASLRGRELESRGCQKLALKAFAESTGIYSDLSRIGTAWQQDVFGSHFSEAKVLTQRCRYRLTVSSGFVHTDDCGAKHDYEAEDGDVHSTHLFAFRNDIFTIDWCGRKVVVPTEKIRSKFAESLAFTSSSATYEDNSDINTSTSRLLEAFDECVKVVTAEEIALSTEDTFAGGEKVMAQKQDLTWLKARAKYEMLEVVSQRLVRALSDRKEQWHLSLRKRTAFAFSRALEYVKYDEIDDEYVPSDSVDADDIVRLYMSLTRTRADVAALPGVQQAPDDRLAECLEADKAALKAYRCYFLGEAYTDANDYKNAFPLFKHAFYLSERAKLEAETSVDCICSIDSMLSLFKNTKAAVLRIHGLIELMKHCALFRCHASSGIMADTTPMKTYRDCCVMRSESTPHPVFERIWDLDLHDYDSSTTASNAIADGDICYPDSFSQFPAQTTPLPRKALLFDIAYNHVTFPIADIDQRAGVASREIAMRFGIFGWLRRRRHRGSDALTTE